MQGAGAYCGGLPHSLFGLLNADYWVCFSNSIMDFFLTISIISQDATKIAEFFNRFHLFTAIHQLSNTDLLRDAIRKIGLC